MLCDCNPQKMNVLTFFDIKVRSVCNICLMKLCRKTKEVGIGGLSKNFLIQQVLLLGRNNHVERSLSFLVEPSISDFLDYLLFTSVVVSFITSFFFTNFQRSNDRNRTSTQLNDEAEKFFVDFIANIEDTDFSSFDGERSDASSTLGAIAKPRDSITYGEAVNQSPAGSNCHPVGTDGVIFPWLQWETSNDGSFTPIKEVETPVSRKPSICDARQVK